MIKLDLQARIKHGMQRRKDASLRLRKKIALKLLRIDIQALTELNYLELDSSNSAVVSSQSLADGFELIFSNSDVKLDFSHFFPRRRIITASQVFVNSEKSHVYNMNKKLIIESSEWPPEIVLIFNSRPPRKSMPVIDVGRLGLPNSGYYHWLTEDLPSFLNNESKLPVLAYSGSNNLNLEVYGLLGLHPQFVPEWIKVNKCSFTSRGRDLGYLHPHNLETLKFFESKLINTPAQGTRNIYISRSRSRRALPGEQELELYLQNKDYEIIFAEEYSFVEQIKLFSEAKSIISPHGAGLANAIWANKSRILEIDSAPQVNRCFEWQSNVCGHEYTRFNLETRQLSQLFKFLDSWLP